MKSSYDIDFMLRALIDILVKEHEAPSEELEYAYRVGEVLTKATSVFENKENTYAWLQEPNQSMGKITPLQMLESNSGVECVAEILNRIEYGFP